jgi:O-acetyl-ADP-ribose deacetylase (regulator of RNase III)
MVKIEVVRGDISKMDADAIVNAANTTLLGGGGVDGAIHRAAGPGLLEECRTLKGCPTGQAKITKGYDLPAKFVIHTAGPVWNGGTKNEAELLSDCYRNSMRLAEQNKLKSIAFPSISTGAYRFPAEKACEIAIRTVKATLKETPTLEKVIFVCFSEEDKKLYDATLTQLGGWR